MNEDNGSILFADDDESFREAYAALLRRNGYDCVTAADADGALAQLREKTFDAFLADIHMPGNSGLELVVEAAHVQEGLPVVLMTGFPSVQSAALSVRLSVAGYMVKPPDLSELLSLLASIIPRFRRVRAVSDSRRRLEQWADDLENLKERIRTPSASQEGPGDYLRISISNLILQLADVERTVAVWQQASSSSDWQKVDLVNAVRHTVDVLEKTRQQFRSKELGELRRHLRALIPEHNAESAREQKTS